MRALAPILLVLASPALAETGFRCSFTVTCAAAGDCAPADLRAEIGLDEDGSALFFAGDAGPVPALRLASGPDGFAYRLDNGATGLITIHADGTALSSRHADGAAVTLFGTCEDVP